ncbi:hypothetical protein ACHWQZ_G017126 [Mnemiopsis leidyi]
MVFLLVLNLLFGITLSEVKVFINYTLTFESDNCTRGQKLLAYEGSPDVSYPVCNKLTSTHLSTFCEKVDKCSGNLGVVTNYTDLSSFPPIITDDSLTFYSDSFCGMNVVCYDSATHCFLPELTNGYYQDSKKAVYNEDLLVAGERLGIVCDKGYSWHWASFITCIKMSSGESMLSSDPQCVPLSEENLMTLLVNVTNKAHLSTLTGLAAPLFDPADPRSVLTYSILLAPFCTGNLCNVPLGKLEATSNSGNEPDGPDHVAALSGEYTVCFETSIISLFLMGLQLAGRKDEFADFNVRPIDQRKSGLKKREIVDNNIEVRIEKLDLVYKAAERQVIGFNVTFYLFQYNSVVPPGVVTKIMGDVSQDKYDLVLESYCRLKFCEEENYEDCQEIPVMRFYSFPKPTVNCTFQGQSLRYSDPVPLICDPNHYNNETNITLCLYGDQYSPPVLPQCAKCGGRVFSNVIYGPSRVDGLSSRGANCIWEIQTSQNNTGQFYLRTKGNGKTCKDPVSYITIREFDSEGNIIEDKSNANRNVCIGVEMKFGSHFEVEFNSDEQSEVTESFIFEFEPDVPVKPWYRRYMAILIAAPVIVLFFVSLVFIGVYCDHKNRQKREATSPVIQLEYGDQTSNGTWKASEGYKKNSVIEDEAISPQPRIHNAVTKPDQQRRRRKKRRGTPSKTDSAEQQDIAAGADSLSPPTYDSWVMISNHGNPGQTTTTTPDTGDMSPDRDHGGASQVFHSPVKHKKVRTSINSTAPLLTSNPTTSDNLVDQSEVSTVKPRKKKRRKKRTEPGSQRPLPTLNGGDTYQEGSVVPPAPQIKVKRGLPPLEGSAVNQDPNGRALPPIIVNQNAADVGSYPYVSEDLGVD